MKITTDRKLQDQFRLSNTREDGIINVDVTDAKGAYLKLYIDGKLDSEQILD